jgi:class 3 adenylate cyclase
LIDREGLDEPTHRLAAVLFTDMHGYSRQMAIDERATLLRLEKHNALLNEQIRQHGGRLVKTIGDAFMVEFTSAVTAVRCGLDMQRSVARWNASQPAGERLGVRIGVHVGDVHVRGDDLFGEAVNVAARLEPQAPVGQVCVSRAVLDQVLRKVNARATALGRRALKNLPEKLLLYALAPSEERLETVPVKPRVSRRQLLLALAALVIALPLAWAIAHFARAGGPVRGGTLRVSSSLERGTLSLSSNFAGAGAQSLAEVLDPLVTWGPDGLARGAATDVQSSPDGRTLTLTLKPGQRFHDHPCFPGGKGRWPTRRTSRTRSKARSRWASSTPRCREPTRRTPSTGRRA